MATLLEVEGLSTHFRTFDGVVRAADGVSLTVDQGEVLALVGESGCGKSVTARSVMGLYRGSRVIQSGSIRFGGQELTTMDQRSRSALRGAEMAMIFQEPMAAFDPLERISDQMVEARLQHNDEGRAAAKAKAIEALSQVGIPDPERRINDYPHQLSGGMLQRVLIAIALMNRPRLLIADEPTTALDVTIQAQVLRLIRDIRLETSMAVLFITHDLGVVAELADRVQVMYAGRTLERGTVREIFEDPRHPYTKGLLSSRIRKEAKGGVLPSIPGSVPKPLDFPKGCRYAPRCEQAGARCAIEEPLLDGATDASGRALPACWLHRGGVR